MPTLESMQKMIDFYTNKDIDMLANNCLRKSFDAKFYQFVEGNIYLLEKNRDVVSGKSINFRQKAVVDEILFANQQ